MGRGTTTSPAPGHSRFFRSLFTFRFSLFGYHILTCPDHSHLLSLLLLLQQSPDSGYSSAALRATIDRAVVQNAVAAIQVRSFAANYQSSIAVLKRLPEHIEGSSAVDQVAGVYRWSRSGVYEQHVIGRRIRTTGKALPPTGLPANGWVIPPPVGEAFCPLVPSRAVVTMAVMDSLESPTCDGPLHPLSLDRDELYRFSGGDTTALERHDGRVERLVRIEVWPRADFSGQAAAFRGSIYLDPENGHLRRIRGQVLSLGGPAPTGLAGILATTFSSALMMDLELDEVPGVGLVPTYQWIELQVRQPLTSDIYTVIRMVTRLRDLSSTEAPGGGPLSPQVAGKSFAPDDSTGDFRAWTSAPGYDIGRVLDRDLADVGPLRSRAVGQPTLTPRASGGFDYFRYNRVEGVFIGAVATLRLRDAAPGLSFKGGVGYATKEEVVRPQLTVNWNHDQWFLTARGERTLDLATKFADPLDYGRGIKPLISSDNYDYIDRWNAAIGVGRYLRRHRAGLARVDIGYARDGATPALIGKGLFGQTFLPNPTVEPGSYLRTVVRLDVSPDISSRFTRTGLSLRIRYERGDGDLSYNRYQAGFSARANLRRVVLTLVGDGGIATGAALPTQQLFLLGGQGSLPGYRFDQFAGDQAWLARGLISVPIPIFDDPVRLAGRFSLPAPSPSISFRLYAGQTEVSSAAMQAAVTRLGTRANPDGPGTIPYAATTDGIRASAEFRLSFFGNLFGVGFAKPLEPSGKWKFEFSVGQTF